MTCWPASGKKNSDDIKDEDNINASTTISRIMNRAADESNDADMVTRRKRRRNRIKAYIGVSVFAVIIASIVLINNYGNQSPSAEQPKQEVIATQKEAAHVHYLLMALLYG